MQTIVNRSKAEIVSKKGWDVKAINWYMSVPSRKEGKNKVEMHSLLVRKKKKDGAFVHLFVLLLEADCA